MLKHEFFRCMDLHKRLKERIKGGIFVSLKDGILSITINAGKGIYYNRNIDDISTRFNIEDLANEIEFDYRRFILKRYFI